jgi:hypothetical protein
MELQEAEARVAAGAAWMDTYAPEGWLNLIDLEALNINSPWACVLGQAFAGASDRPGYFYATDTFLSYHEVSGLGFNDDSDHSVDRWNNMATLTEVWRRYIAVKREELALAA